MIPLYGFRQGDTMGLVIVAQPTDTMVQLAAKLESAADVRVGRLKEPCVVFKGRPLPGSLTVKAAGFQALDKFEVIDAR